MKNVEKLIKLLFKYEVNRRKLYSELSLQINKLKSFSNGLNNKSRDEVINAIEAKAQIAKHILLIYKVASCALRLNQDPAIDVDHSFWNITQTLFECDNGLLDRLFLSGIEQIDIDDNEYNFIENHIIKSIASERSVAEDILPAIEHLSSITDRQKRVEAQEERAKQLSDLYEPSEAEVQTVQKVVESEWNNKEGKIQLDQKSLRVISCVSAALDRNVIYKIGNDFFLSSFALRVNYMKLSEVSRTPANIEKIIMNTMHLE